MMAESDVLDYLSRKGWEYKLHGQEARMTCPLCHGGQKKDRETFAINLETGAWNCMRLNECGQRGNLRQLKQLLGDTLPFQHQPKTYVRPEPVKGTLSKEAVEWFKGRGITETTLNSYGVTQKDTAVIFPYTKDGEVVNHKHRTKDKKMWQDKDAEQVLYLRDHIRPELQDLLIVEGEIDCLTMRQLGFDWCVSVPGGASNLDWVENEWKWLERFTAIYLGYDADKAGDLGAEKAAQRLGRWRCRRVRWPHKDPSECLKAKMGKPELEDVLIHSEDYAPEILRYAEDYEEEMLAEDPIGKPTGFPALDDLLGGLRTGEVTVWTGRNGDGKTTFLNQLTLNLLGRGASVCTVSLEMRPAKLLRWMAKQAGYFIDHNSLKGFWAKTGGRYVLLDTREQIEPSVLMETMEYVARRIGPESYIIDSLLRINTAGGADWLERQKTLLNQLTGFAQNFNTHVHLVAHPRKGSSDNHHVDKVDIAGSYDITNLAFNVIAIRRLEEQGGGMLEVLKNREHGRLGKILLQFDEKRKLFREITFSTGSNEPKKEE